MCLVLKGLEVIQKEANQVPGPDRISVLADRHYWKIQSPHQAILVKQPKHLMP
jgi:hypothetical protein